MPAPARDEWDQFPDAPTQDATGTDPWDQFPDAEPAATQRVYDPFANDERSLPPLPGEDVIQDSAPSSAAQPGYFRSVADAADEASRAVANEPSVMGIDHGTAEAVLSLGTGVFAPFIASARGLIGGYEPTNREIEEATYQPRSESGKAQLGLLGAVTAPLTEALTESGADVALLPIAAQSQAIRSAQRTGQEARALKSAAQQAERQRPPVPTTEELTKHAKDLYKLGKEADIVVPPKGYTKSLERVRSMVAEEGIDPTLHPKSTAVLKRLNEAEGQPLTLQQAETLRKIALDAEDDLNPVTRQPTPDARMASKIVDSLDESLDALTVNSPARAAYARSRRSQLLDRLIHRAGIRAGAHYTQAGMEHALRQEFKTLALNPRRMRGLTSEQKAAVEKVAKGGNLENAMRNIGKFDPTTGGMAAALSFGTGGLAALLGAGPAAAVVPVAGFVGKRAATRMTARNVERAREVLVGRGLPQQNRLAQLAPADEIASAGQAFDAERAAAAAAARGSYDVEELPGESITLETPRNRLRLLSDEEPRAAARTAVATRAQSAPSIAQIETEMRSLERRGASLSPDSPELLELDARYETLKAELALAKKRAKRNRIDQLSGNQ